MKTRGFMTMCCCLALLFSVDATRSPADGAEPAKAVQSYRGLKFSVVGVKRVAEHEEQKPQEGNEWVVVSTKIDRSGFKPEFSRECRLERATLRDAGGEHYRSMEDQLRITPMLTEGGRTYGDPEMLHTWGFDVPKGKEWKTFVFEFDDERVDTGGEDPDENVTELSFDLPSAPAAAEPAAPSTTSTLPPSDPGTTGSPENSPTYVPKDEALAHKRKADESEDLETFLKECRAALEIEPRYAPWWSNLGDRLGEAGRWQEAEDAFKRAVELNPKEPEYRANLALAVLRLGRKEEATQHAKAAMDMAREQKNELHGSHPVYQELGGAAAP